MKTAGTKRSTPTRSKQTALARPKLPVQKDRFAGLNLKLAELARKKWPQRGREKRIARAEEAWNQAVEIAATFKKLGPDTIKWIAEDPDLENI
jgi:hypothetical protein